MRGERPVHSDVEFGDYVQRHKHLPDDIFTKAILKMKRVPSNWL